MQYWGTITIEITSLCNLSCKHCFNRDDPLKIMDFYEFKEIIQKFSKVNIPQFIITGGEPFLHPHFKDIISFISQTPFNYVITTNGTIINREVLELISFAQNITIQISLDGSCANIHDEQRGKGTFDRMETFCKILEAKKITYQFHSTITKINYKDMECICHYAIDRNVCLDMTFVSLIGNAYRNKERIALSDNEKIYTYFNLRQKMGSYNGIKLPNISYSCAFASENYVLNLNIKSDGLVNVCNCMTNYSTIGNIDDLDLENIKTNVEIKNLERKCKMRQISLINGICKDCIVKECGQGCIASAIALDNEMGEDGDCALRKKIAILNQLNQLL